MAVIHSFEPIIDARARILILGSMPGQVSLLANQYYGHPRNTFWRIMGDLFDFNHEIDYDTRIKLVKGKGVAVWDVMQSCTRESSLDSDIIEDTIVPNNFPTLLATYDSMEKIFFNGAKAQQSFQKFVQPTLGIELTYTRLPSTSPAHASMSYEQKREVWQTITA